MSGETLCLTCELGWVQDSQVKRSGQGKSVNRDDPYDQGCAGAGLTQFN